MVLMMTYETQNHWSSGLCPSSGIINTINYVSETGYFPSSGEGKTPALLDPFGPVTEVSSF
jgi:hypothetical protein